MDLADYYLHESIWDESWNTVMSTNRLVLLVKEPTTIFAYWEVDELHKRLISEHFTSDWIKLPHILRVHDVTDILFDGYNAHDSKWMQVDADCDRYYIQGVQAGRRYLVDFGTKTWHGEFFCILRSNVVETPPVASGGAYEPSICFGKPYSAPDRTEIAETATVKSIMKQPAAMVDFTTETRSGMKQVLFTCVPYSEEFDGYSIVKRQGGQD